MEQIIPLASTCRVASPKDSVLNSECCYTFHTPYTTDKGILVNLNTFTGAVEELSSPQEGDKPALFLRIVKTQVEKPQTEKKEVTKIGIGVEGGFDKDKFDIVSKYSIVLLSPSGEVLVEIAYSDENKNDFPVLVVQSADSIISHSGYSMQQDLKTWELDQEPIPESKYYKTLEFVNNGVVISPNPKDWKCQKSGDTDNLWLNLSDGYIGGGRRNWDGSGGSNGALDHFVDTGEKFPLVVKLGTITSDPNQADCYSYAKDEDGPVKIPNLSELLEKRGIQVASMKKTAKSTSELEVELNATYAFDAITEAGSNLVPVVGAGYQGLQNLGNSCYMNSVVQTLFGGSVPELTQKYLSHKEKKANPTDAPTDVFTQTKKLCKALTSGEFANPNPPSNALVTDDSTLLEKYRVAPRMFKHAIAKNHTDFGTGQQQDAAEYLQFLLESLQKVDSDTKNAKSFFAVQTSTRTVCKHDGKVKYKDEAPESFLSLSIPMEEATFPHEPEQKRLKSSENESKMDEGGESAAEEKEQAEETFPTVSFQSCIDSWSARKDIRDLRWQHLQNEVHPSTKTSRFKNFPPYLFVQLQRFTLGPDWVPQKLKVNIDVEENIDISSLRCQGPQEHENLVPDTNAEDNKTKNDSTASTTSTNAPEINEVAVAQLSEMGFSINGCKRALVAVGGSDIEAAMNWIFEHNMDPDFNDPLPESSTSSKEASEVDESVVTSLTFNLGCFTKDQVRSVLKAKEGDAARAADWLFSNMVSAITLFIFLLSKLAFC